MVMSEFMAENGLDFLRIQKAENGPRENHMTFTGNKKKRGIGLRTVLRLVQRDWNFQMQPRFGFLETFMKFRMTFRVEAVGGFKQFHPKVFGVIHQGASRGEPVPQIALVQFKVISNLDVKRERIENRFYFIHHCLQLFHSIKQDAAMKVKETRLNCWRS